MGASEINIEDRSKLYGVSAEYKNHNLFIEAGAGAGKTEAIGNLVVDQLLNGVAPEKIVVITFTNKAAQELNERICKLLKEYLKKEEDINKCNTIRSALNNIYKMNISTIHHFCNVILNENCFKAKISYNSTLLEEVDESKRRDAIYYEWFHSLEKSDLNEIYSSSKKPTSKLKITFEYLCKQFDDVSYNDKINYDYEDFFKLIYNLYDLLIQHKYSGYALSKYADKFIEYVKNVKDDAGLDYKELYSKYYENKKITIGPSIKISKSDTPKTFQVKVDSINKDLIEPLILGCSKALEYVKCVSYKAINKYALKAWEYYKKHRDRESLNNNQLIYETYELLKDKDVKEKLSKQYDVILIDEFQDTDKYQNMFIIDLAKKIDERKNKEGKLTTSLIVVGDPKQSIYAFRGADFDLFMKTKNEFSTGGLKDAINVFFPDNFRSNRYILKWVNDSFSTKSFYDGYEYKNMKVPSTNEIPDDKVDRLLAGVYSFPFNDCSDSISALVKFIKKLKENNYQIYDKKDKESPFEPRPIKYSDILVLTTSKSQISQYVLAFNKENIRTLVAGEFDLCSSSAFNYLYRILNYVFNKDHNNKEMIQKSFNIDLYDNNEIIEKILDETKEMSPYGKLIYVFSNIELILKDFNDNDIYLLKSILSQVVNNVAYNSDISSIELMDKIDELIHEFQDAQISLHDKEDAVQIMNIHKSKGLTSQIVFVVDSGSIMDIDSSKFYKNTLYLNNIKLDETAHEGYEKSKDAEKLRLEYVAATRAAQVLFFEQKIKSGQMFNRKDVEYELKKLDEYHVNVELPTIDEAEVESSSKFKKVSSKGFEPISEKLKEVICSQKNPSSLENKGIENGKFNPNYLRPSNALFGTLFHKVMESCITNKNKNLPDIIDKILKEDRVYLDKTDADLYKDYLEKCAKATIYLLNNEKLLDEHSSLKPELKFSDYYEGEKGKYVLTGSIDLLVKNEQGDYLIIDYKTDANYFDNRSDFEDYLRARYCDQINSYNDVVKKLYGENINVISKIVWFEENKSGEITAHFLNL